MNTLNISKRAAGKAGEDYAAKMLEANGAGFCAEITQV